MKKILQFLLLLLTCTSGVQAQWWSGGAQSFDGNFTPHTYQLEYYITDPVNNCWQVGPPIKNIFNAAPSAPNAIVTDTWDPYPTNSNSAFVIKLPDTLNSHFRMALRWIQKLDLEYKRDFGIVEISIDSGQTWENVFTSNKVVNFFGYNAQNVDTMINGMRGFTGIDHIGSSLWLCYNPIAPNNIPIRNLQVRFTLHSDAEASGQDGWMLDNFELSPTVVHILQKEEGKGQSMYVSPVPADESLYITAPSIPEKRNIDLLIIRNAEGKEMFRGQHLPPYYHLFTNDYPEGVYTISMESGSYNETRVISVVHQR